MKGPQDIANVHIMLAQREKEKEKEKEKETSRMILLMVLDCPLSVPAAPV